MLHYDTFWTVALGLLSFFGFFLSITTVNMQSINVWAREPWKLIIDERINKVLVVQKTAAACFQTEFMLPRISA